MRVQIINFAWQGGKITLLGITIYKLTRRLR